MTLQDALDTIRKWQRHRLLREYNDAGQVRGVGGNRPADRGSASACVCAHQVNVEARSADLHLPLGPLRSEGSMLPGYCPRQDE